MKAEPVRDVLFGSYGERLRVRINPGAGDRVPLLICGGFGVPLEILDDMVEAMPGETVIRFDPPGIGGSRNRLLPYRFAHLAKVLDRLLAETGHSRVDVLGISWGGMLAQEFALDFPHRCRKLILASTLPGVVALPGTICFHLLTGLRKWKMDKGYSRMASLIYGGRVTKRDWGRLERYLAVYLMDLPGYFGQLSALVGWTSILRLRGLSQPVLLLYGEDDPIIPIINADILKNLIPDAQLIRLDCGHLFPWTRSHQVCEVISGFRSE